VLRRAAIGRRRSAMTIFALSTWCPYPTVNGSTLRIYHLLRALAGRHDVDLLTFAAPAPPDAAAMAHLRTFCRTVTVIPRSPFAKLRGGGAGVFGAIPRSLAQTDDAEVREQVRRAGRQADLALGFQLPAARYLDEVAAAGVARIFEEAEPQQVAGQIAQASGALRRWRRRLTWRKQARYLARLSAGMAAVTVVSELERDTLLATGVPAAKIHVVPNAADAADLARPRAVAVPVRLIYSGAITFAPNLEAVVWCLNQVMPRIRTVRPDVQLWVTGDTGAVPLDRMPHPGSVRFTGRLPDIKDAVSGSAVAVVPLLSGGGTRLKVLEALALGVPVVSTAKGVEGLAVTDGVHALVADDPGAFAERVLRVIADPALAARLSSEGRALVATSYTWEASGQRLLAVVDRVMEGSRP